MRPSEHAETSLPLPASTATPTAHAPAGHGLTSLALGPDLLPWTLLPSLAPSGCAPCGAAAWFPAPPPPPPPCSRALLPTPPPAPTPSAQNATSGDHDEAASAHFCDRPARRKSQSLGAVPSLAVARIRPPAARATEVRRRAGEDGETEEDPRRKAKTGPRARRPLAWRRQPETVPHGVARTLDGGEREERQKRVYAEIL